MNNMNVNNGTQSVPSDMHNMNNNINNIQSNINNAPPIYSAPMPPHADFGAYYPPAPTVKKEKSRFQSAISFLHCSFSARQSLSRILFCGMGCRSAFLLLFYCFLPLSPPIMPIKAKDRPPLPFPAVRFRLPAQARLPFQTMNF